MKLVLFQTSPAGEVLPGLLTDRGVVDISAAVRKNYTPQLVMQGIIDDFEKLRPALDKLAKDGAAMPLDKVPVKGSPAQASSRSRPRAAPLAARTRRSRGCAGFFRSAGRRPGPAGECHA